MTERDEQATLDIGEYVFTLDGQDTKNGQRAPRLRVVTGPPVLGLYPCRTIEGTLSIGFRRDQLRKATEQEIKSYMPEHGFTRIEPERREPGEENAETS